MSAKYTTCAHDQCARQIDVRNITGMCGKHSRGRKKSGFEREVTGSVRILHASNGGIDMDQIDKGPVNYAGQLARYIRDPSTIRARTMNEWGWSPSIEQIKELIAKRQAEREVFRAEVEGLGESDEDEADFFVRPTLNVNRRQRAENERRDNVLHFTQPVWVEPEIQPACFSSAEIINAVAKLMKVTVDDIKGTSRRHLFVRARTVVCHVLRQRELSLTAIGYFLNCDHSTVYTALRRFEQKADDRMRDIASRFLPVAGESEAA